MLLRIWTMFVARTREFYRDTAGLSWNLVFPILLIAGFAFAFSKGNRTAYKVGVMPESVLNNPSGFLTTKFIQFLPVDNSSIGQKKIGYHQLDMFVSFGDTTTYWINPTSQKGYLVSQILKANHKGPILKREVEGKKIRYVDWLTPGILAMNMMFSALFGVGWVIVRYRKTGYLKRLKATPIRAHEFLLGQVLSRMVVITGSSILVYLGTNYFLNFTMRGSYLLLFAVFTLGTLCMISLGLLFAARFTNEELVSGLLNFLTWPMMFISGVWFSLEGVHPVLQKLSLIFPLTHVVNATRAIMLDGAGPQEIMVPVSVCSILSVVFLGVASAIFKWE